MPENIKLADIPDYRKDQAIAAHDLVIPRRESK
jgi:hypothetical protein